MPEGAVVIIGGVELADRIKSARTAAGLTQQQLADACGISMQAVSAWEQGRSKTLTGPHLFCIADTLRVDPRWLATGETPNAKPDTFYTNLTKALAELPAEKQELVRRLVDSLQTP